MEEVATYQVLDSVEDEELEVKEVSPVTRGRGRKAKTPTRKDCKPASPEETVFDVLDSIGGEVVEETPAQPGRPRRGLATKDPEKDGKIKPDDSPEGTHGKQEEGEEAARPVDSAKQEPQGDKQPAAGKRRSGRGRKEEVPVSGAAKEGQQRVKDLEEEAVYQVVDSTEDDPHEEEPVDSLDPTRRSSLAKSRATRTCSKASKGEEPVYQVVNSKGEEEEQILLEEPLRGKRGHKVTGSDAETERADAATKKKKKTTEQTATPLPDNQSKSRSDSEVREFLM